MGRPVRELLACTACSWAAGHKVYYPRDQFPSISGRGNHRGCPHSAAYRQQIANRTKQTRRDAWDIAHEARPPEFEHPLVSRFIRGHFTKDLRDYGFSYSGAL